MATFLHIYNKRYRIGELLHKYIKIATQEMRIHLNGRYFDFD